MTTPPDWSDQARRLLAALQGLAESPAGGDDEHPGECRWCPHCQVLAVLRGDRPELTTALNDVLATTITALRQFAGEAPAGPPAEPPAGEATDPDVDPGPGDPAPVVQRIEIA
jgi:hypothetical protein